MPDGTFADADAARDSKSLVSYFFEWFGQLAVFCARVVREMALPPYEGRELVRQLDEVGAKSLPLIALAGAAIGVVLSLQTRASLTRFGAKSMIPVVAIIAIVKETGPTITALIFCGRVGAGIGAELASMKVTEQIDAMEVSAVNVYKLLAATRVLACILMLPLLTMCADGVGILLGWIANTLVEPVSLTLFINQGFRQLSFSDILPATFKTAVFGWIIGTISCFEGMRTTGGTEGVGRSAICSVVLSSLFVILADVLLVRIIITVFG